jgi:hypothetical protein
LSAATKYRLVIGLITIATIGLGLFSRRLGSASDSFLANGLGAMLYEVLWIGLLRLVFIRRASWKLAVAVFCATCGIEALQLYNGAWLVAVRDTLPGRLVLGANGGFDPLDLLHYALGSVAGGLIYWKLRLPSASLED